ncbi:MAG: hypothetical protein MI747_13660 [Desulfobacterales bacterium]|nr:hypothetical protein [Desulfobacterales bacterium]
MDFKAGVPWDSGFFLCVFPWFGQAYGDFQNQVPIEWDFVRLIGRGFSPPGDGGGRKIPLPSPDPPGVIGNFDGHPVGRRLNHREDSPWFRTIFLRIAMIIENP